jgi:hypothetical protein
VKYCEFLSETLGGITFRFLWEFECNNWVVVNGDCVLIGSQFIFFGVTIMHLRCIVVSTLLQGINFFKD